MSKKLCDRLLLKAADEEDKFGAEERERLLILAKIVWGDLDNDLKDPELDRLMELLRSVDDDITTCRDKLGKRACGLLDDAKKVAKQIEKAREENLSKADLKRFQKDLDYFLDSRDQFFQRDKQAQLLRYSYSLAWEQQKKDKSKRKGKEAEWRHRLEDNEVQIIRRAHRGEESEAEKLRRIDLQRKLQHKLAGHSMAASISFRSIVISVHAHERWRSRGLKDVYLRSFLNRIDDGEILYKLQQISGRKWEVVIRKEEDGDKLLLVLILSPDLKTIVTILRDGEYYNYQSEVKQRANPIPKDDLDV